MTVLITLTTAGADSGPFNLYSDVDGYLVPFETLVPKASLVSGYLSVLVPNGTTIIRVQSNNSICTNFIDIPINPITTTTTSSSSTTTTTSTTTYPCECVRLENTTEENLSILITPCDEGSQISQFVPANDVVTECVVTGSVQNPAPVGIIVTYCPGVPETPPCTGEGDCGTCGAP